MSNELGPTRTTAPFSPAPWRLYGPNQEPDGIQSFTVLSGTGAARFGIASIKIANPADGPTATANAHLIIAAPDGYALAEDAADFLLATFGQVGDEGNREGWSDDDAFELYCKLTRFLARARGQAA